MNKNKHLLLWSSLGVLALLVAAAVEENFLKTWRRIQASASTAQGPIDVHLRQIVVPDLKVTDRCVSCHVGMAPGMADLQGGPVLAAHKPMVHDPNEFGCTVCHGGQGLATEQADAHGEVRFWPEPMIPTRYASAGCGACHSHLRVTDLGQMREGRNLVERYDCLACHRIDGRGGTLRPGGAGGMEGPDLSHVGITGLDPDWYQEHLAQYEKAETGPWKHSFGPVDDKDRQAMEGFLKSRVGASELIEAKALFHSLGCRGCHKIQGVGGDDGPDLTRFGERDPHLLDFSHVPGEHTFVHWIAEHFRWPAKVVAGSKMPDLGLTEPQIDKLTLYMLSLRQSHFPEAYWPKDRILVERFREREFATDGATLFGTFCAACHGPAGEGRRFPESSPFPSVANPDFLAVASDDFLAETIRRGRPGRRMPAWNEAEGGLRDGEIAEVVAHLRRMAGVDKPEVVSPRPRWVQAGVDPGRRLYAAHCAGCHGAQGDGVEAPALNNPILLSTATDTYLLETIRRGRRGTAMPGFAAPSSPAYPALSPTDIESIVAFIRTWEDSSK
ncbi:MAG: c-type cytochrome [Pirellulales bacterium]|nr:c-type cytochrome [Pirellulales bacterium]